MKPKIKIKDAVVQGDTIRLFVELDTGETFNYKTRVNQTEEEILERLRGKYKKIQEGKEKGEDLAKKLKGKEIP